MVIPSNSKHFWGLVEAPFGTSLWEWSEQGIFAIHFFSERQALESFDPKQRRDSKAIHFFELWKNKPKALSFVLKGSEFQKKVWQAALEIPFGERSTYAELAYKIGRPKAYRAVGTALGNNKLALAVPCHRVLPSSGGLGGYFWGVEQKSKVLEWELHEILLNKAYK